MNIHWIFGLIYAALAVAFVWRVFNKNKKTKEKIYWGFHIIYFALVFGFLANFVKIINIQYFVPEKYWQDIKKEVEYKIVDDLPKRGTIYWLDKNDEKVILSEDMPLYEIYFNGKQVHNIIDAIKKREITVDGGRRFNKEKDNINDFFNVNDSINKLAAKLANYFKDKDKSEYAKLLKDAYNGNKTKKLGHIINIIQLDSISDFALFNKGKDKTYGSCLYTEEKSNRMMPYGNLAKRTIGTVDYDKKSAYSSYGIDWEYDSILRGVAGKKRSSKISINKRVTEILEPKQKGADITLTLDMYMQEIVADCLRRQAQKLGSTRACAILMEVETGAIKAMVNLGGAGYSENGIDINMVINSNNELGSVFKVPSIMVALEKNLVTESTVVNVATTKYGTEKDPIKDSHTITDPTVMGVIVQSSNVGTANIVCDAFYHKRDEYYNALSKLKFDAPLQFDYYFDTINRPAKPSIKGSRAIFGKQTYGYVGVSPLYMLRFYNAIANNGRMVNPFIIRDIEQNNKSLKGFPKKRGEVVSDTICSENTLKIIQKMLLQVVENKNGTAHSFKSDKVTFAGKTGTADIKSPRIASQGTFCGYFPADNPKYSCIVVMFREGSANLWGAESCSVFKDIAERIFIMEPTQKFPQSDNSEQNIDKNNKKIAFLTKCMKIRN